MEEDGADECSSAAKRAEQALLARVRGESAAKPVGSQEPLPIDQRGTRCGADENCSPNSLRETTPEPLDEHQRNLPYSPNSNPFGARPKTRTPGGSAAVYMLRRSTSPAASGGPTVAGTSSGRAQDAESWLSSPEVSLEEVQASWDAVGRIEKLLEAHHARASIWDALRQGIEAVGRSQSRPASAQAIKGAAQLAELTDLDQALTWTSTRLLTDEQAATSSPSWRSRITNPTFQGSPSPTSSRASSMVSEGAPLVNAAGYVPPGAARRGSGSGDGSAASPLQRTGGGTARAALGFEGGASPEPEDGSVHTSAELHPRSFQLVRSGSTDSLASMLSFSSEVVPGREGGGSEGAREPHLAAAAPAMPGPREGLATILEPGESPLLRRTGAAPYLGASLGHAARADGAFASPIEVHAEEAFPAARSGGAATPFAALAQPAQLTPVMRSARAAHAGGAAAPAAAQQQGIASRALSSGLIWQLLLLLGTFALLLSVPAIPAALPCLHHLSSPLYVGKDAARSSAGTFPLLASARPQAAWWNQVWTAQGKAAKGPLAGARDFMVNIFRPETPGTRAAPWGLLPSASQWVPTPHLDRLLGKASAWWRGSFPGAAPAQGSVPGKAGARPAAEKPAAAAKKARKEPKSDVPAPKQAPAASPKQAPPQPPRQAPPQLGQQAPESAPESAQPSNVPQPPSSAAQRLNTVAEELSKQAAQARNAAARTGAWASGKVNDAAAALSGAARAAPNQARSAWQRARLKGAHALSEAAALSHRIAVHSSAAVAAGIAAVTSVLLGILAALLLRQPSMAFQQEEAGARAAEDATAGLQGQLACTPATAGQQNAARRPRKHGSEAAALLEQHAGEGHYNLRHVQRMPAPASSTPLPLSPRPARAARTHQTAPVEARASEQLASTADTPAARTRARTRRRAAA